MNLQAHMISCYLKIVFLSIKKNIIKDQHTLSSPSFPPLHFIFYIKGVLCVCLLEFQITNSALSQVDSSKQASDYAIYMQYCVVGALQRTCLKLSNIALEAIRGHSQIICHRYYAKRFSQSNTFFKYCPKQR